MAVLKCKMCGGDLEVVQGVSVAECEYCGSRQTIPSADDDKKMTLFTRANRLRFASEFDKAYGVYESIVADFPSEAEAYWGLVLCKYGIEYVDDPATGKKVATCHRSSFESVMDDDNFEQTLENADTLARGVYREEAKQIEEIRKGIVEISSKEAPYDIFICYKETAEDGNRTVDSVIAQDVYDALTEKGYRVFFSRISLEDKLGVEYEPYIFAALNSAKIMLAFGTDYEYYNAVWVKNEWSRFIKLMARDKSKYLIPCFKNIDAYDMPKEFAKLQAQDMGKVGAMQDLLRGIEKILPRNLAPVAEPEKVRRQGPAIIRNVCSIGTCDYDNYWPTGTPKRVFNYDDTYVVAFNISVTPDRLRTRSVVHLGFKVVNENGLTIVDEEIELAWASNYDRLSKTFHIRGKDGSVVPTGKYHAEFWVDESAAYEYDFVVTSDEEIEEKRQEEKRQQILLMPERRAKGLCQYCGGTFRGLFSKSCAVCGKRKDY